jgi:hypothetical protein
VSGASKLIEAAERRRFGRELARCRSFDRQLTKVVARMKAEGVQVEKTGTGWRLRLLGRTATATSSARCAATNWIAAVLKEAGLDG